jgi:hypothetical protein
MLTFVSFVSFVVDFTTKNTNMHKGGRRRRIASIKPPELI